MIYLLTTQGRHARRYHLPQESVGNFRSIVRSIVGGSVFIISNRFKTDIFYESSADKHETITKLWMMYLRTSIGPKHVNQIRAYSGDREALLQFFHSLSFFSGNKVLFKGYLSSFRKAFYSDPKNSLVKKVLDCDQHVIAQHKFRGLSTREALIANRNIRPPYRIEKKPWSIVKPGIRRFEN